MNRRNFLRAAVALAVSPAIPAPAAAPLGAGGVIGATFVSRAAVLNESWVCFVHPDCAADLAMIRPLAEGVVPTAAALIPEEVFVEVKHFGSVGRVDGFRFVESP